MSPPSKKQSSILRKGTDGKLPTLLDCLDGVGSQDGIILVATANDLTCLTPPFLSDLDGSTARFNFVIRNEELRREYYRRLNPVLAGEQFELAISRTEGFSFAQLRETYILGAQSAFENEREITVTDVTEAIELQSAGAYD